MLSTKSGKNSKELKLIVRSLQFTINIILKRYAVMIFLFATLYFSSCDTTTGNKAKNEEKRTEKTIINKEPAHEIKYHLDSIAGKTDLDDFNSKYDSSQKQIILALNRLSPGRIRVGSTIVLPDTILPDLIIYSPFPAELKLFDTIPKLIVIAQRIQAFAAYETGKMVRWGPASTGRKSKPTPTGLLYTNYKARLKISTIDGSWKMPWYFNIQNRSGIGMHQFVLPGYPASHSCVRLLENDAKWIFNWADEWELSGDGSVIVKNGTPVIIFGNYEFGKSPPWKSLPVDLQATQISAEDIVAVNAFLPQIIKDIVK